VPIFQPFRSQGARNFCATAKERLGTHSRPHADTPATNGALGHRVAACDDATPHLSHSYGCLSRVVVFDAFGIGTAFLFHEAELAKSTFTPISSKGELTMHRKMLGGMICLILLGIFFVPQGRADEADKKTIVTINEPIQVPGKVLPAGTYVFKILDSNDRTLVLIYTGDDMHLVTTVRGIPDSRMETPDKTIIQLEDLEPGQPEALKAWFYPGDNSGVEFVYPTK
jgi:hypothetical protein